MAEKEDDVTVVWLALANAARPLSSRVLDELTGLGAVATRRALSALLGRKLVVRVTEDTEKAGDAGSGIKAPPKPGRGRRPAYASIAVHKPAAPSQTMSRFVYSLVPSLDALSWAQAVDVGVPLAALEKHARLHSSVRREAERLASASAPARVMEADRQRRRQRREADMDGRAASKAAATDLARLLADARAALRAAPADILPTVQKNKATTGKTKTGQAVLEAAMARRQAALREILEHATASAEQALDALRASLRRSRA